MAVLVYAVLAAVLLVPPLLANPGAFLGHPESDLFKHVWGHWWLGSSLARNLVWPVQTDLLDFPTGGRLFVIDPLNAALSGVLTTWLGLSMAQAYNLLVLGNLVAGGWAAWALASRVTGDARASWICGTIYAFSPWVFCYTIDSGVSETLGLAWLPLSALALLALLEQPSSTRASLAASVLILTGLNSWHFLLYSLLLGTVILAGALVAGRPDCWLPRPGRGWAGFLALAVVLAGLGLAPLADLFLSTFQGEVSIEPSMQQRVDWLSRDQSRFFVVADFLVPGKDRLRLTETVDRHTLTPYVGLLALALAGLGAARGGGRTRLWVLAGLGFFLLSLGPGVVFTEGWRSGAPVNLFWRLLSPVTGAWITTTPFRLHFVTLLCVGVLASVGLARLARGSALVAALACAVAAAEVAWLSPIEFPMPVAPPPSAAAYAGLQPGPHEGLLDLPPLLGDTALIPGAYFYGGTLHQRGVPYRTGGVFSPEFRENLFFADQWRVAVGAPNVSLDPLAEARGLELLAARGYRHVVLHGDMLSPSALRRANRSLRRWLGPPVLVEGAKIRFSLQPACPKS